MNARPCRHGFVNTLARGAETLPMSPIERDPRLSKINTISAIMPAAKAMRYIPTPCETAPAGEMVSVEPARLLWLFHAVGHCRHNSLNVSFRRSVDRRIR